MSVTDVLVTIGKTTFDLWNTGGVFTIAGGYRRGSRADARREFSHERFWECVCAGQFDTADDQDRFFFRYRPFTVDDLADSGQVLHTGGL